MKNTTVVTADASTKKLVDQHRRVQEQIATLPAEKQKEIKAIQKLVDHEIAENNAMFFSDGMFAADAFLKRNRLPGSCKEDLMKAIERAKVGSVFMFMDKPFIKSFDGLVHSAADYIRSLELTIAEQVTYKEVKYVSYISELDKLSSLDLIKLSFKKLFKNLLKGKNNG